MTQDEQDLLTMIRTETRQMSEFGNALLRAAALARLVGRYVEKHAADQVARGLPVEVCPCHLCTEARTLLDIRS